MSMMEKKSPEALAKAEQEQEILRRLELRAQLEEFWTRTSRFTKVSQVLNADIAVVWNGLMLSLLTKTW